MLEKPDFPDEKILTCLRDAYGLSVARLTFLPLGADPNTAVYQALTVDETSYFVKLRRGRFDELSVTLPKWLSDQGIRPIIPPLTTTTGQLWANLDPFALILYPFVEGRDGYEVPLSERHWHEFGVALRGIHAAALPPTLLSQIRRETYSPHWRNMVNGFLERLGDEVYDDPVARELAAYLPTKRAELGALVARTEALAQTLQTQTPEFVVCHSDLHAGNFLIANDGALTIVDWDDPILAPKERDLMYIGGGQIKNWRTPQEEEALFYPAYGPTQVNPAALAYYRYERIIQDIAVYCEQLLLSDEGGEDRLQSLHYLQSNFLPNSVLALAYQSEGITPYPAF